MLSDAIIMQELKNYHNISLNQLPFAFLPLSNAHFYLMNLLNKNDGVNEWQDAIYDFYDVYYTLLTNYPKIDDKKLWKKMFLKRLNDKLIEKGIYECIAYLTQNTLSIIHQFDTTVSFQKRMLQEKENIPEHVWMIFESS